MDDATSTCELVLAVPHAQAEAAAAAFLAGYGRRTREGYSHDLRCWLGFCRTNGLDPFTVRRPHIELFGRQMEETGYAVATVARRLSTVCVWYGYLEAEDMVAKSPAKHVRRPRVSMESTTLGLDRDELGRLLYTAERARPNEYALICLLGLNGLRVSEACDADITKLGSQRGHRTLSIIGKGNKPALIPLAPRTGRAVDLAVGDRHAGRIVLNTLAQPMARNSAAWIVAKLARRARIAHHVSPHSLRHAFITGCLDAGVPLRDVQEGARHADPRTTIRYDRGRGNLDRHPTYVLAAFVAGAA
jgi:site-specific recombinase XerD